MLPSADVVAMSRRPRTSSCSTCSMPGSDLSSPTTSDPNVLLANGSNRPIAALREGQLSAKSSQSFYKAGRFSWQLKAACLRDANAAECPLRCPLSLLHGHMSWLMPSATSKQQTDEISVAPFPSRDIFQRALALAPPLHPANEKRGQIYFSRARGLTINLFPFLPNLTLEWRLSRHTAAAASLHARQNTSTSKLDMVSRRPIPPCVKKTSKCCPLPPTEKLTVFEPRCLSLFSASTSRKSLTVAPIGIEPLPATCARNAAFSAALTGSTKSPTFC